MSFTGEYNNLIDQKNRLSIPAKYRKALNIENGILINFPFPPEKEPEIIE